MPERVPRAQDLLPQPRRDARPARRATRRSSSARIVAERLNGAAGPVHVVAPLRGFSLADGEGGDLWDPVADGAFLDSLSRSLRSDIPFEAVDAHVDDHEFADVVAARYLALVPETVDA